MKRRVDAGGRGGFALAASNDASHRRRTRRAKHARARFTLHSHSHVESRRPTRRERASRHRVPKRRRRRRRRNRRSNRRVSLDEARRHEIHRPFDDDDERASISQMSHDARARAHEIRGAGKHRSVVDDVVARVPPERHAKRVLARRRDARPSARHAPRHRVHQGPISRRIPQRTVVPSNDRARGSRRFDDAVRVRPLKRERARPGASSSSLSTLSLSCVDARRARSRREEPRVRAVPFAVRVHRA